jgi:hypothetical protein
MGEVILRADTKASEFGHLTGVDIELDAIIIELVYLSCLAFEFETAAGKMYLFEYGAEIKQLDYKNPFDIFAYFKNVSKKSVEWVFDRTLFYKEERAKRQADADKKKAEADKKKAEAEKIHQSVIEKKLKNLELAHKLRQKMLKDGVSPDEVNQMVAYLLQEQKAQLLLPSPKSAA